MAAGKMTSDGWVNLGARASKPTTFLLAHATGLQWTALFRCVVLASIGQCLVPVLSSGVIVVSLRADLRSRQRRDGAQNDGMRASRRSRHAKAHLFA